METPSHARGRSRGFFGETLTGIKYEVDQDIPTADEYDWDADSDQSGDGFEDFGAVRVHYGRQDEKPVFVGNYLLGAKLGEGANAKVREGIHVISLRIVAVKIIDRNHIARIKDGVTNMKREIAIMKSMKKHPNVIELLDVIEEDPKIHVVMELANGCSLEELINSAPEKRIPEEQAKFYFRQLMQGLQHLHGKNVVHRDIKPANLMLTTEHELKISDFGVAEFLDQFKEVDEVTRTTGSPAYLPPEIASGDYIFYGMAVDVWAAGITLYHALVGHVPFDAEGLLPLFNKIRTGKYEIPDFVDDDARDLIDKMLHVNPSERISVRDVLRHRWLQDKSVKNVMSSFLPVERRDIQVIRTLSSLYEEDEGQQQGVQDPSPDADPSQVAAGEARSTLYVRIKTAVTRVRTYLGCTIM